MSPSLLGSYALLAGCVFLTGVATVLATVALMPPGGQELAPRGYRETKRTRALAESTLLRLVWPLVRLFTSYARLLPGRGWREGLGRQLVAAGEPAGLVADEFVGLNLAVLAVSLSAALVVDFLNHLGPTVYVVAVLFGIFAPRLRLSELAQQRFKAINRGLPPVLDLVVMAMVAGSDFMGALAQVVARWSRKKDPLYDELTRFLSDLQLGLTRRQALDNFAQRSPTELVKTFAGSVIEAEQRGTPLVEILAVQAEVARQKRFQLAEQIAGRAGVLVKLPLFIILISCLVVMFGGFIIKAIRGEVL